MENGKLKMENFKLKLVSNNEKLSKKESEKVVKQARTIGEILFLKNKAEDIRNKYNTEYVHAVMTSDTDKMLELTPRITECGGKIRAYNECISLIMEGI